MDRGKAPANSSSNGVGCSTILLKRSHVLLVDGDAVSRKIVEKMLLECNNQVTTCSAGTEALAILRKRKEEFDLVMSDVSLPDVNALELLQCAVAELQLPVIMILAEYNEKVRTIIMNHGANEIMVKPITKNTIMNIRKHLASKKQNEIDRSSISQPIIVEDRTGGGSRLQNAVNRTNIAPSTSKGGSTNPNPNPNPNLNPNSAEQKKRKRKGEQRKLGESSVGAAMKKPRLIWEPYLHKRFVEVVNELGIENAVPKKILERMNTPGLTRDNVASHLQKYRLQLCTKAKNQKIANRNSTAAPGLQSSHNIHSVNILSNQNPVHSGVMSTQVSNSNAQIADVSNISQSSMQLTYPNSTYPNRIIYHSGNPNSLRRRMQLERSHREHPSQNMVLQLDGFRVNNLPNPQQTMYSRHDISIARGDSTNFSMDRSMVVDAPQVLYANNGEQSYTELPTGCYSHASNMHGFVREDLPITTNHFGATSTATSLQSGEVTNDNLYYHPSLIRSELTLMRNLRNFHLGSSLFSQADQEENRLVSNNIDTEHNRIQHVVPQDSSNLIPYFFGELSVEDVINEAISLMDEMENEHHV